MPTDFLWAAGASNSGLVVNAITLVTTELNSLTTGSGVISSVNGASGVFTNSNTGQAVWADLYLKLGAVAAALSAGANVAGYFLTSPDGSVYEPSITPPRAPDFIIPLPATAISAGLSFKTAGPVRIPALNFKIWTVNNSGQTLAASANTIVAATYAVQY